MARHAIQPNQLGFDTLLAEAEETNRRSAVEREYGHLPASMDEAVLYFKELLDRHHVAMLAADVGETMAVREKADALALRLNDGDPGILAGPDAPGCRLARLTKAPENMVPLWGQAGSFILSIDGMRVRIETDGIFGIGSGAAFWQGFSAHAVDWTKPFISETGYRSFLGVHAEPVQGMTFDAFAAEAIRHHLRAALKGRPVAIADRYRDDQCS